VYPGFQPAALPAIPGLEGMGVIEAVGEGVTGLTKGARVVPFFIYGKDLLATGNGAWQEYLVVKAEECFPVPDDVDDAAAAQFVVNPFTAYVMIQELAIPQGKYLLQTAGGSTLGRQVIQMCKHMGLKSINVVRRKEQADELLALGADLVLCSAEDDIAARVKEITGGEGAWGALDSVGGALTAKVSNAVRNGGTVLIYGAMSGLSFEGSIVDCLFRGVTVRGFWITSYAATHGLAKCREIADAIWPLFSSKVVVPFSGTSYPVAQVKEAVAASMKEARGGKVLLSW
jgi:trans-2-enoyl-CoA reductase